MNGYNYTFLNYFDFYVNSNETFLWGYHLQHIITRLLEIILWQTKKQSHSSKILVFFCKSFMIVLKRALEFIYLFFANWGLFVCDFCFYLNTFVFPDPPEIELETDRVHSGENKEAHLTCLIHGNPTPTVSQAFLVCFINDIPIWCEFRLHKTIVI